jgi:hypothetical protein
VSVGQTKHVVDSSYTVSCPCRFSVLAVGKPPIGHRSHHTLLQFCFPHLPWRVLSQSPSALAPESCPPLPPEARPPTSRHWLPPRPERVSARPWNTTTSQACACASASPPRGAARGSPPVCAPPCRKPPRRDPSDSVHKVARREIGGGHRRPPRPAALSSSAFSCPEKFRNFQLQVCPRRPPPPS